MNKRKSNDDYINEIVYLINLYAFSKYKTMDRIISKRKEVDNLPEQDRLYINKEVKRILDNQKKEMIVKERVMAFFTISIILSLIGYFSYFITTIN